jgi:hypothetical protein
VASQVVTKSAFFQARKQLSYKAFIELNRQILGTTYKSYDHLKTWRGFRLCAIDGSSIRPPNKRFVRKLFSGLKKGGFCNYLRGFFFFINHLEKLV